MVRRSNPDSRPISYVVPVLDEPPVSVPSSPPQGCEQRIAVSPSSGRRLMSSASGFEHFCKSWALAYQVAEQQRVSEEYLAGSLQKYSSLSKIFIYDATDPPLAVDCGAV
jgi:hypothetical protein